MDERGGCLLLLTCSLQQQLLLLGPPPQLPVAVALLLTLVRWQLNRCIQVSLSLSLSPLFPRLFLCSVSCSLPSLCVSGSPASASPTRNFRESTTTVTDTPTTAATNEWIALGCGGQLNCYITPDARPASQLVEGKLTKSTKQTPSPQRWTLALVLPSKHLLISPQTAPPSLAIN